MNKNWAVGVWAFKAKVKEIDTNGNGVVVTERDKQVKGHFNVEDWDLSGVEAYLNIREQAEAAIDQGIDPDDLCGFKVLVYVYNSDGEQIGTWDEDFTSAHVLDMTYSEGRFTAQRSFNKIELGPRS